MSRLELERKKREIAEKIKEIRKNNNLTQKQFADMLELTVSSVAKYENNERSPSKLTLYKIADLFDIEIGGISKKNEDITKIREMLEYKSNTKKQKIEKIKILLDILNFDNITIKYNEENDNNEVLFIFDYNPLEQEANYHTNLDIDEFLTSLKRYAKFLMFE